MVVHEVHMNRRLDCYTYHNHALNHEAHLWVCDGQVMFQTPWGRSPWHGSFENDVQRGEITMFFQLSWQLAMEMCCVDADWVQEVARLGAMQVERLL